MIALGHVTPAAHWEHCAQLHCTAARPVCRRDWKIRSRRVYAGSVSIYGGLGVIYAGPDVIYAGSRYSYGDSAELHGGSAELHGGSAHCYGGSAICNFGAAIIYGGRGICAETQLAVAHQRVAWKSETVSRNRSA
jgi:hypothetical protein